MQQLSVQFVSLTLLLHVFSLPFPLLHAFPLVVSLVSSATRSLLALPLWLIVCLDLGEFAVVGQALLSAVRAFVLSMA